MKFATIPLWTKDRPTAAVDCTHTMALPMPGVPDAHGGAAPLTLQPLEMTLERAVEYWWRVRKWKIHVTVSGVEGGSEGFDLYPERQMEDERELVGTPQAPELGINAYDYGWHDRIVISDTPGSVRYINAYVGMCPPSGWNAVVADTVYGTGAAGNADFTVIHSYGLPPSDDTPDVRLIYPVFFVAIYGYWEQGSETTISASTLPFPVAPPLPNIDPEEPYSITNGNTDIPISMQSENIHHWGVSSFYFEPFTWWPWANADGSEPTWNAGTGARL